MKLSFFPLAALSLLAATLTRAEEYEFKDTFNQAGRFSATGEIVLENVNGSVEVRTWDKNEILIEGEKSAKTEEEFKRIDLQIDLTETRAVIKVRLPKRTDRLFGGGNIRASVRFKLTVPATAALAKISTVNSSVLIEGARGVVNASSVNGAVRANGLAGPVNLETVNGSINARFDRVMPQQPLAFETVNGQITISLPKDAGVEFHGEVVNGSIKCDFPLELEQRDKKRHKLSGKIGDGRTSLDAETVNGSIHLQSQ